jgi:uncharacterized membrane-anchored protein YjiN (DUF445 family)
MKPATLAPFLLVLALALLTLAEFMGANGGWAWVKAGAEAAAVGGLADWFAVVVLFRHPFGIRIPHTAIVPKSKARIADSMAAFVHDHFLQRDKLMTKLAQFNVSQHLGDWLRQATQAQHFLHSVRQMLLDALRTLDDERIRHALTDALTTHAQHWDAASTLGQALDLVTKDHRHQQVLSLGLTRISALLGTPQVRDFLGQQIHDFVEKDYPKIHWTLNSVSLASNLSLSVAEKLRDAAITYMQAVLSNPAHPQRAKFSRWVNEYLTELRTDAALQKDFNATKDLMLQSPEVRDFLDTVWMDVKARLLDDLASDQSTLAQHAERALQGLGDRLAQNADLQDSVNRYFEQVAGQLADQLGQGIPKHIADTIKAWDDAQLVHELERSVGNDLQYIRINGTLVGAALGLLLHALPLGVAWISN